MKFIAACSNCGLVKMTRLQKLPYCAPFIQIDLECVQRASADDSRGVSAVIGWSLLHGSLTCP